MPQEQQNQLTEEVKEAQKLKKDLTESLYGKEAKTFQRDSAAEEKFWTEHSHELADKIKNDAALRAKVEQYIAEASPSDGLCKRLKVALESINKKSQIVSDRKAFLSELKTSLREKPLSKTEGPTTVVTQAPSDEEKGLSLTATKIDTEPKTQTPGQKGDAILDTLTKAMEDTTSDAAVKKYAEELARKPDWKNAFLSELFGKDESPEAKDAVKRGVGFISGSFLQTSALLDKPELAPNPEMKAFLEAFKQSAKDLNKGLRTFEKNLFKKGEEDIKAFAKDLWKTPVPELCKRLVEDADFRLKFVIPSLSGGISFELFLVDEEGFDPKLFKAKMKEFSEEMPKYFESLKPKSTINPFQEMLDKAGIKDLEKNFKAKFPEVKNVHNFGWPFLGEPSAKENEEEMTKFIEDLLRQPDWQKKIIESKDEEFLGKLRSLDYDRNKDIKAPELRAFLNEWKTQQSKAEQKTADYILKLFPQRLESVRKFLEEVQKMPQEKLKAALKDSAEFRYKFFVVVKASRFAKIAFVNAGTNIPDILNDFKPEKLLGEKGDQSFAPTPEEALHFFEEETKEWQKKNPQLQNANFQLMAATYSGGSASNFGSYVGTSYGEQQSFETMKDMLTDKAHFRKRMAQEYPLADKVEDMDDETLGKVFDVMKFINDLFPKGITDAVAFAKNLKTLPKEQLIKSFKEDPLFSAKMNMVCEIEKTIAQESKADGYSNLLPENSGAFLGKDLQAVSKFFNGITEYVDSSMSPLKRDPRGDILKRFGFEDMRSEIQSMTNGDKAAAAPEEKAKKIAMLIFDGMAEGVIRTNIDSMLKRFPADSSFQNIMAEAEKLPTIPVSTSVNPPEKKNEQTNPSQKSTSAPTEKPRPGVITSEMASKMSVGELMAKLIETIGKLTDTFNGFFDKLDVTKLGQALNKDKPKFTPEELDKHQLDLGRDNEKVHAPDKTAEYAATLLGLGLSKNTENSANFLEAFQNSGKVLETDWNKKKEIQIGDVLFFGKENAEKKKITYLTAVVCENQPQLKMKMVPAEGGKPLIMTVEESDFFKRNELMGVIHMPTQNNAPVVPNQPAPTINQPAAVTSQPISVPTRSTPTPDQPAV